MIPLSTNTRYDQGFTIIEVLVTLIVAAIFITTILQVYLLQTQISTQTRAYTSADLLAYNNLRTYANGQSPTWFQCNYTGTNTSPDPQILIDPDPTKNPVTDPYIPAPATQSVVATAPYGCGGSSRLGYPIQIVSTVTYGPDNVKVTHATFATY